MGRASLSKPSELAAKLVQIRVALGLSQNGLIKQMGLTDALIREEISAFERGVRVPPLHVLLRYARMAGICTELLIDDTVGLPEKLPFTPKACPRQNF